MTMEHPTRLEQYAESELRRAGLFDPDSAYDGILAPAVMRLLRVFAAEEHSGGSAALATDLFARLVRFEPLTPLTGEDAEWTPVADGLWQNRRCSRVFKDVAGAHDIEGIVFVEPDGTRFTNAASHVPVRFPYTPKTILVRVEAPSPLESDQNPHAEVPR